MSSVDKPNELFGIQFKAIEGLEQPLLIDAKTCFKSLVVTERKACACKGSSTRGMIRVATSLLDDNDTIAVRLTFYPGQSCDVCGEPWKTVIKKVEP